MVSERYQEISRIKDIVFAIIQYMLLYARKAGGKQAAPGVG
jgi:hypothetical protein